MGSIDFTRLPRGPWHNKDQNPYCMWLLTHMSLKCVHDTGGKELNFHDASLEPGSVSGAGVQRRQDGLLPLMSSQSRWEMQSHSSRGLGAQVLRVSWSLRKTRNPDFYTFPLQSTLPIFKCWQLNHIFINHCVGQIKHAWLLNLAH